MRRRTPAPVPPIAALLVAALVLAAPAAAQHAGVLLGFEDGSTLWVAPDAQGRVRALRSDTLLIVPRADGFWKTGVSVTAGSRPSDRPGGQRISRRPRCMETEYRPSWFELAVWAAPLGRKPYIKVLDESAAAEWRQQCGTRDITVTFVGTDYVSVDEHYTTEYGGGMNVVQHAGLVPIDTLARRGYADLLELARWRVDPVPNDSATHARLLDECRASEGAETIDRLIDDQFVHDHFIRRAPGRWQHVMRFSRGGAAWQGIVIECGTAYPLPAAVVGHDALPMSFEAIRRQVPDARDAVASPAGDMVAVLARGTLLVFAPHGGHLGAPIAEAPAPPADLVLAQWATGSHVARWSAQLAPYLADRTASRRASARSR